MKVISLLQPWASLVVLGHKKIETRSWDTKYRGPLLIHASISSKKEDVRLSHKNPFYDPLAKAGFNFWGSKAGRTWKYADNLPRGAIIGMVNVVDTYSTPLFFNKKKEHISIHLPDGISAEEEAFGDYSPGRYVYLLSDPVVFNEPISAKGMLGLWNYDGPLPI